MLEILAFAIAFSGCVIASYWDLKTTEVPDDIPYLMGISGVLINFFISILINDTSPLAGSVLVGSLFFAFGYVMFHFGQWGGADAKILSAVGFLMPERSYSLFGLPKFGSVFPFPLAYVANVFFFGAVYMILYAIAMAMKNRKIFDHFIRELTESRNRISANLYMLILVALFTVVALTSYLGLAIDYATYRIVVTSIVLSLIFLLWKFLKSVETVGFRKKINVSDLKTGDVLMTSKRWVGADDSDIKKIKKSGKRYIWIKEGVRFVPAFLIALIVTVYYGDVFSLMMFA